MLSLQGVKQSVDAMLNQQHSYKRVKTWTHLLTCVGRNADGAGRLVRTSISFTRWLWLEARYVA